MGKCTFNLLEPKTKHFIHYHYFKRTFIQKCVLFAEWNVEIKLDIKWQDALITAAHEGLGNSIMSHSLSGHFGRDKMCTMLEQRSDTYINATPDANNFSSL